MKSGIILSAILSASLAVLAAEMIEIRAEQRAALRHQEQVLVAIAPAACAPRQADDDHRLAPLEASTAAASVGLTQLAARLDETLARLPLVEAALSAVGPDGFAALEGEQPLATDPYPVRLTHAVASPDLGLEDESVAEEDVPDPELAALPGPATRLKTRRAFVALQDVYYRQGPGLQTPVVGTLRAGDVLIVDEVARGWHCFSVGSDRGCVHRQWLRHAKPGD